MKLEKRKISDIVPYKNNPRKNDSAAFAVMESIEECGYITPIIIDENDVVLAGHTRLKALTMLGKDTVDVVVASGLSDEKKKKFRLLDNKVGEVAEWDLDMLAEELSDIDFGDFDFGFDDMFSECGEVQADVKIEEKEEKHKLSVDKVKIELTDVEYEIITQKMDEYRDMNKSLSGFVEWVFR